MDLTLPTFIIIISWLSINIYQLNFRRRPGFLNALAMVAEHATLFEAALGCCYSGRIFVAILSEAGTEGGIRLDLKVETALAFGTEYLV